MTKDIDDIAKIREFDGTNHTEWATSVQLLLIKKGKWELVESLKPTPKESDDDYAARVKAVSAENNIAVGLVGQTVASSFKRSVLKQKSIWHVWDYFHKFYSSDCSIEEDGAVSERTFYALTYEKSTGIMNLMQEIDRVGDELKFSDEKKRKYVFEIGENPVLPLEWQLWLRPLKDAAGFQDWDKLKAKIQKEGLQIEKSKPPKAVMNVEGKQKFQGNCHKCGKQGHKRSECKAGGNFGGPGSNSYGRGENGGNGNNSYTRGMNGGNGNNSYTRGMNGGNGSNSYERGMNGRNGRGNGNEEPNSYGRRNSEDAGNYGSSGNGNFQKSANKVEGRVRWAMTVCNVSTTCLDTSLYLDSGATDHLVNQPELLWNLQPYSGSIQTAAKGETMAITGKGELHLGNGIITDVYLVPSASKNLISATALADKGASIFLDKIGFELCNDDGAVLLQGIKLDGFYKLTTPLYPQPKVHQVAKLENVSLALAHQRLGHINLRATAELCGHGSTKKHPCDICMRAKFTELPYSKAGRETVATRIFQIWRGDLKEMPSPGIGGERYYAILVDEFTDETININLVRKSDFFGVFLELMALYKNQTGHMLQHLKSDGGGEFVNNDLIDYCREMGILFTTRNAYAKNQNAQPERRIRTSSEMGKAMRLQAGLGIAYWPFSIATGVFIRNRIPSGTTGESPHFRKTGQEWNLKYLRVWGCICWVFIHPEQRANKQADRSEMAIFLGYTDNGYLVETIARKRLIESRDVRFDEARFLRDVTSTFQDDDSESEEEWEKPPIDPSYMPLLDDESTSETDEFVLAHGSSPTDDEDDDINKDVSYGLNEDVQLRIPGALRRSTRLQEKQANFVDLTYTQALNAPDSIEWKRALKEEFTNLIELNTWEECWLPAGAKAVPCKVIMHRKETGRYRPRLCIRGDIQRRRMDENELPTVFAPVAGFSTFRMCLAYAASQRIKPRFFDVGNAFPHAKFQGDLYLGIPEGYLDLVYDGVWPVSVRNGIAEKKTLVLKLLQALYGAIESANLWYEFFKQKIMAQGFSVNQYNQCLFIKRAGDSFVLLALWVDDFIWITNNDAWAKPDLDLLFTTFRLKETHGKILGMNIEFVDSGIFISHGNYIATLLSKYNLEESMVKSIPINIGEEFVKGDTMLEEYSSLIGALMHSMNATRPDIALSLGIYSRFVSSASVELVGKLRNILKYLKGSADDGLLFEWGSELEMTGYVDSDFAMCKETRRSLTGWIIYYCGTPVLWKSQRQKLVTNSTSEAEYVALSDLTRNVMVLKLMLDDFDLLPRKPVCLKEDNTGCIAIATKPEGRNRTKHIEIKYHYTTEQIDNGSVVVEQVDTLEQWADGMTKALAKGPFEKFKKDLKLISGKLLRGALDTSKTHGNSFAAILQRNLFPVGARSNRARDGA